MPGHWSIEKNNDTRFRTPKGANNATKYLLATFDWLFSIVGSSNIKIKSEDRSFNEFNGYPKYA